MPTEEFDLAELTLAMERAPATIERLVPREQIAKLAGEDAPDSHEEWRELSRGE